MGKISDQLRGDAPDGVLELFTVVCAQLLFYQTENLQNIIDRFLSGKVLYIMPTSFTLTVNTITIFFQLRSSAVREAVQLAAPRQQFIRVSQLVVQ